MSSRVIVGDCREAMAGMEPDSIDAVVCDPPYGLKFMGVGWDTFVNKKGDRGHDRSIAFDRIGGNHNPVDSADAARTRTKENRDAQAWHETWAREAFRVLKPGGYIVAFGGTRTHHRLMCAIEDAGFEIRDTVGHGHSIMAWVTGQGFPKSRNVSADDRFCQCLSGVRGTDSPDASEPTEEVLLTSMHGDGPPCGLDPQGMFSVRRSLDSDQQDASVSGQDVLTGLRGGGGESGDQWNQASTDTDGRLRGVSQGVRHPGLSAQSTATVLQQSVSGEGQRAASGHEGDSEAEPVGVDREESRQLSTEDEGREQSFVEGRSNPLPQARELQANQVRAMPAGVPANGTEGRLRYGASSDCGEGVESLLVEEGDRPSPKPQSAGQRPSELPLVPDERCAQTCGRCGKSVIPPGMGSALKPAWEPIVLARKPLVQSLAANVERWGTGALNIDASRVDASADDENNRDSRGHDANTGIGYGGYGPHRKINPVATGGRWPSNLILSHAPGCIEVGVKRVKAHWSQPTRGDTSNTLYQGGLVTMGDKRPVGYADPDGTEQVASWDCVENCPVAELDRQSGERPSSARTSRNHQGGLLGWQSGNGLGFRDTGGASRYFPTFAPDLLIDDPALVPFKYQAKASRAERNAGLAGMPERNVHPPEPNGRAWDIPGTHSTPRANHHPTVKPLAIMRWLVRLVAPPGGTVLDPFLGSGTTGMAAVLEGFDFIGIEQDDEYAELARRRIAHVERHGERWLEAARTPKARPDTATDAPEPNPNPYDGLPLFALEVPA